MSGDLDGEAVCTCKHVPGFHQHPDFEGEFYVCGACDRPTRMYLEAQFAKAMKSA